MTHSLKWIMMALGLLLRRTSAHILPPYYSCSPSQAMEWPHRNLINSGLWPQRSNSHTWSLMHSELKMFPTSVSGEFHSILNFAIFIFSSPNCQLLSLLVADETQTRHDSSKRYTCGSQTLLEARNNCQISDTLDPTNTVKLLIHNHKNVKLFTDSSVDGKKKKRFVFIRMLTIWPFKL